MNGGKPAGKEKPVVVEPKWAGNETLSIRNLFITQIDTEIAAANALIEHYERVCVALRMQVVGLQTQKMKAALKAEVEGSV